MEEAKKRVKKGILLDSLVAVIMVAGLVVCGLFWKCKYDMWVTVLAGVVVLSSTGILVIKRKKSIEEPEEVQEIQ